MDDIFTYEIAIAEAVDSIGVSDLLTTLDVIPNQLIDAIIEEV